MWQVFWLSLLLNTFPLIIDQQWYAVSTFARGRVASGEWGFHFLLATSHLPGITATGIAPDLHRISLFMLTFTVSNQIGANVRREFLCARRVFNTRTKSGERRAKSEATIHRPALRSPLFALHTSLSALRSSLFPSCHNIAAFL